MKKTNLFYRGWHAVKENFYFLIVILATFIALALVVTLAFGSFYKSAREDAVTMGNMTVSLEAQRIDKALDSGINTLLVSGYTVDRMMQDGADAKTVNDYLIKETQGIISGMDPDFSGIYGVIGDVYVDGIGWQPEQDYDPFSRPWYLAAAQKKGELAIVSPYLDAQTGSIMLSFSKMLSDGKSAISLDVRLDNIYEATQKIQLNGNGYCFLADQQGQVIAHRDESQIGKNYLTDSEFAGTDMQSLYRKIQTDASVEDLQNIRLDGRDCMVFAHTVQDEWNIVLVVESRELFGNIRTALIRNILISLAIFILVGYFCTSNYHNKKRAIRFAEEIRTDDLTGLNNRGEFDRYLRGELKEISAGQRLYLLLFDADGFKSINDRFGHQEGDRALRYIAGALKKVCHGTDWFCARYGGDEFVIISKGQDESDIRQIPVDIGTELDAVMAEKALPYRIGLSCGYACFDPETQSLSDLIDTADYNLYQVKAKKAKESLTGAQKEGYRANE